MARFAYPVLKKALDLVIAFSVYSHVKPWKFEHNQIVKKINNNNM